MCVCIYLYIYRQSLLDYCFNLVSYMFDVSMLKGHDIYFTIGAISDCSAHDFYSIHIIMIKIWM